MENLRLMTLALAVILATGCAVPKKVDKEWVATGGSRADATVELSYEYDPNREMPQTNDQQALELAKVRCRSWGYRSAEPFGGVKNVCNNMAYAGLAGMVCLSRFVTKQYQCLGRGSEASTNR
jgi:hypothetical protein